MTHFHKISGSWDLRISASKQSLTLESATLVVRILLLQFGSQKVMNKIPEKQGLYSAYKAKAKDVLLNQ